MNVLVTGGAGYIGSHTIVELASNGHTPIVVDNFSNSSKESLARVQQITGTPINFYEFDLRDKSQLDKLFSTQSIDAVIHFAGLKAVGESVENALHYYQNNLESTLTLLGVMRKHQVKNLVFSSSATIYGNPKTLPIRENAPKSATNPYGQTKLMIEQILEDISFTKEGWSITSLRYFNPIGAHPSGLIGEDPNGRPNNLLPYITQVAIGKLPVVSIFGNNYDTLDGTGVRDYVHVVDLARAHIAALKHISHPNKCKAYNIGTGEGTSVLKMIQLIEKVSGRKIPYEISPRRAGDIASCYADPSLAKAELQWSAIHSIEQACQDAWNWQQKNPQGYNNK